jgi:hypothetical protein
VLDWVGAASCRHYCKHAVVYILPQAKLVQWLQRSLAVMLTLVPGFCPTAGASGTASYPSPEVCKFHLQGWCRNGDSCTFRHEGSQQGVPAGAQQPAGTTAAGPVPTQQGSSSTNTNINTTTLPTNTSSRNGRVPSAPAPAPMDRTTPSQRTSPGVCPRALAMCCRVSGALLQPTMLPCCCRPHEQPQHVGRQQR